MNLFFHFFIAHIFMSFILSWFFLNFSNLPFLGGFMGTFLISTIASFLFSSLIPSWFSLSHYGVLYWVIYYLVPLFGALLGIFLLGYFSRRRNDI
jgi:hypothetical protein